MNVKHPVSENFGLNSQSLNLGQFYHFSKQPLISVSQHFPDNFPIHNFKYFNTTSVNCNRHLLWLDTGFWKLFCSEEKKRPFLGINPKKRDGWSDSHKLIKFCTINAKKWMNIGQWTWVYWPITICRQQFEKYNIRFNATKWILNAQLWIPSNK